MGGKKIFIVCGEESGDLHGSTLMRAIKRLDPSASFGGMGGARMREEGLTGLDSSEVSVVGVVEVLERLPRILKAFKGLKKALFAKEYDAVVLIDLPDFNLKFASDIKGTGIPIVYYISPQVWAWRRGRVKKIARLVDKMLVVFPFEEAIYREAGVDVEYVGHPLAGAAECALTQAEARSSLGLQEKGVNIALLPGSRTGEIKRLLPVMLRAASLIEDGLGERARFLIPAARSIDDGLIDRFTSACAVETKVVRDNMYALLRASDAAMVTSGTATLETALIGTPMVLVYRMSPLSFAVARALVGVKHAGLPNIIAGREIMPELLQEAATPERISREVLGILTDKKRRARMQKDFGEVKRLLGNGGAPDRAARAIFETIAKGPARHK